MDWDPNSLELAGITRDQLPRVLPTTTVLALTSQAAIGTGLQRICRLPSVLPTGHLETWAPVL
jgi:sugar (pentulose or hexulose) kinase